MTTSQSNSFEVQIIQRMDLLRNELLACAERDRDALELNLKLLGYMEHMNEVLTEVIADVKKLKEQKIQKYLKQQQETFSESPPKPE